MDTSSYLRSHIRTVPDWPAPGVQFRDITPLLADARGFGAAVEPERNTSHIVLSQPAGARPVLRV